MRLLRSAESSLRRVLGRHGVRLLLWAPAQILVLWLLQSALWTPRIPLPLRLAVATVGLTAAIAPRAGLILVALLAPLGHLLVTRVWSAYPFELGEALVLAFCAGYLWFMRPRPSVSDLDANPLAPSSVAFTIVVFASCALQIRVLQLWHEYPLPYAADLLRYLRVDYLTDLTDPRPWVDGRGFLHGAALLLESIALMQCARTLCARRPSFARHLSIALVASGTVMAAFSLPEPFRMARETHSSLWMVLTGQRWASMALPSLNTAGAYFLLVGFLALSVAVERSRYRIPMMIAAVASFGAMWLTQTRSAIVAGLIVVAAGAAWTLGARVGRFPLKLVAIASGAIAVTVGVAVVFFNPFALLASGINTSLRFRVLAAEGAMKMLATAPITGVGIGQYEMLYQYFAPSELLKLDPRTNNAHNYLLWMATELGLIGASTFVWVLLSAGVEGVRNLQRWPSQARLLTFAGISAFVITWSIGQPTSIPAAAYLFWLSVGIATAPESSAGARSDGQLLSPRPVWTGLLLFALIMAAMLPARVAAVARQEIDLSRVRYGFSDSGRVDEAGRLWWAGPRATFFQRATVSAVDVRMAAPLPTTPNGVTISIRVDGRPQPPVVLPYGAEWRTVRLRPDADAWRSSRYWRIDLDIRATGVPRETPDQDRRIRIGTPVPVPVWERQR